MEVESVGVEEIMTLPKLDHMCETGGQDSMYVITGAATGFQGTTTCYRPLRPHPDF